MFKRSSLAFSIAAVIGLAVVNNASALTAPTIGLDPTGSAGAGGWIYSDIWSDAAATGVDVGAFPFVAGDQHTFHTQFVVGSLTADGSTIGVPGLNGANGAVGAFELTKTLSFLDEVVSFTPSGPFGGGTVVFGNPAGGQTASPNLILYYDDLFNGGKAVSGSGAGTVSGFGDGLSILEANLVSNTSAFVALAPGLGQGAFDLLFEITSYDADYLDLSNLAVNNGTGNPLVQMRITGNLTQPLQGLTPVTMFDGTPVAGNQAFSITAAETFAAVPEPNTILLLATSLGLIGVAARRRKA